MDTSSMLVASTFGLVSLAVKTGFNCYGKSKKQKKLFKMRISSLIMSRSTGKTLLKKKLNSVSSDLDIVDMDEVIESVDSLDYLKKSKEYVDMLLKTFPKKRFLLLLSTKAENDFLNIPVSQSFVVCPDTKLFNEILGDMDPLLQKVKKDEVERSRLELIKNTSSDKLNIYDSFDSLYNTIKTVYKLQPTF